MALVTALFKILQRPTIWDVLTELMVFVAPLWIAILIGVMAGWAWKPKWVNLTADLFDCSPSKSSSSSESPSSFSGLIPSSLSVPSVNSLKLQLTSCISWFPSSGLENETSNSSLSSSPTFDCSSSQIEKTKSVVVRGDDFHHLCLIVEEKDGGPAWIPMMDRSTHNMSYRAWTRDPDNGPPQYRSSTIFEDTTPEMVRDFFWDDDFRMKWDNMLIHAEILEECPTTGTIVVQWVRKFPFFCSDREYIIGRRIWKSGPSYYCVTKGVPYTSVPRRNKPRRVDLYYSSWHIRAVESKRGDGQMTACEVLLFHHEEMGIPWELAKLGVRQGMWGAVKKIEPGLRAYLKEREAGAPLSRYAFMAQINTKISADYLDSLESKRSSSSEVENLNSTSDEKPRRNIPKLLVVGGVIALVCSLDQGILTKAIIFGVGRRFANVGKKL